MCVCVCVCVLGCVHSYYIVDFYEYASLHKFITCMQHAFIAGDTVSQSFFFFTYPYLLQFYHSKFW